MVEESGFEPLKSTITDLQSVPFGQLGYSSELFLSKKMERKTRFELATLALARRCSTTEPLPQMVEETGFEPVKAKLTDLQSVPFGQLGNSSILELARGLEPPTY